MSGITLDRLASFRETYIAILVFVLLYVFTVKGVEQLFGRSFRKNVAVATRVDPAAGPVADQIQRRVDAVVRDSAWVRVGGVRATAIVLGADGQPIYAGGRRISTPMPGDPIAEAARLLPATADVVVSVPHNSLVANGILISYAAALIYTLFLYDRRRQSFAESRIAEALAAREETAARAAKIEAELAELTRQVDERVEAEVSGEIASVRAERVALQEKLAALARREAELRAQAGAFHETLVSERAGLEEMLDEALADLSREGRSAARSRGEAQARGPAEGSRGAARPRRRPARATPAHALQEPRGRRPRDPRPDRAARRVDEAARRGRDQAPVGRRRDGRRAPQGGRPAVAPHDLRAGLRRQGPHLLHDRSRSAASGCSPSAPRTPRRPTSST